ncbi:MAG: hypothetical protein ABH871_09950 [Pseudomonadota bacterium]
MRRIIFSLAMIIAIALAASHAYAKKEVLRVPGGANIPSLGISIDASYDPRLDNFVPGYKVINVALINQGFSIIYLDPEKDKWQIKLAGKSKLINAIHDLRRTDPEAWNKIPKRARALVGYPLVLPIGAREVIDIFVPDSVDVEKFNELDIYLRLRNTRLQILVRQ